MTLPRVHEILELLYPLGFLPEDALEVGKVNHEATKELLWPFRQGYKSYTFNDRVQRLLTWCYDNKVTPTALESSQQSTRFGFQGHPDFLGFKGKINYGLDWKFSEAITESNYVQIEAYRMLCPGFRWGLVQIPKEGPVKFIPCPKNPEYQAAFLNALGVWKWRNR